MTRFHTLVDALRKWRIWTTLALQDIQTSYRRSILGPLWLTITMALRIYSLGFLYAHLLKTNMNEYMPYLAAGMICWELIAKFISEGPNIFLTSEQLMTNYPIAPTNYLLQMLYRNVLIFFHFMLAYLPVFLFFNVPINLNTLLFIPGIMIVIVNGFIYGSILGMLGLRFRDLPPIIESIMRIAFFLTPVLWMPNHLSPKHQLIVNLNPLEQFLCLLRNPLLGKGYSTFTLEAIAILTAIGLIGYVFIYLKKETRLVFWN